MTDQRMKEATILIVDDEGMNVELLEAFLAEDGYQNVVSTRDPRRVPALFDEIQPDLVLLDLHMPHLSGFEVMAELGTRISADDFVPIVVLTADITPEARQRALAGGAKDFLTKPLDEIEVLLRIRNLLRTRLLYVDQRAAREGAEAGERRAALLAEASRVLSASFDTQTTLAMLAQVAAPGIADLCVIEMVDEAGAFIRAAYAPADPSSELLPAHADKGRGMLGLASSPADAALTERPILLYEFAGDSAGPPRPGSMIWAPLVSSGRSIGALTLVRTAARPPLDQDDVTLAAELACRTTLAIDNARLYRDAREATRARDEILAVVAHDLRNPLSTIGMAVSLVLDMVADGPPRKHLEIARRSAERMNRLVQDLLEVTRVESGKLTMDLTEEPLGSVLDEALATLRPLAAARSIDLDADCPDDLPLALMDSARILQVISNLVGNAIKFTPEGGRIRIGCRIDGGDVRFSVTDTGPGIPPEQLPHIFSRFWQARDGDSRGIGLGLSIARGIVEAHGGGIWVESTLGVGTSFVFTIPATAEQMPEASDRELVLRQPLIHESPEEAVPSGVLT